MLSELITSDVIRIYPNAADWKDAVQKSCQALIDNGAVEPRYVDAIFRSHEELGPYYVVGPSMAMPHARPEDGVNRLSLAITVIQQGVHFNSEGNDPVKMLVTLAATDSESHVGAIAQLAELFMNEEHVEQICHAQTIEDVLAVIKNY
ncbi:PTS sugar transporter subunit IIA [Vibrio cholerae]|uniref:PTS sugar transporter subunit IIA n=1 Tax=Vibrio cholerae TaxID=666 RepID=UPI0004E35BA7|nr:PTS sugar transporter subunit IIA [Vibrio cholerae]EGR1859343.1 PTS sugar transporter subunit IIA [Vibrio cholerae]EKF9769744.1 PTS sugar transporter subunit IIA [Vibrio cholerae]ELH5148950.1 PTS sugar transporter subunit IIA [Vibrio cholerae]KFE13335.1 phosphoenolpyruvate-dependent sugar phosphotransferase system, EIIA 2 family protein [Vibrio cholerae]MBJ6943946.1 PTS sugar transporter subunit IIA [Vibrio cholerae]